MSDIYEVAQHRESLDKVYNRSQNFTDYSVSEQYEPKTLENNFTVDSLLLRYDENSYKYVLTLGANEQPSVEQKKLKVVSVKDMVSHARQTFGLNAVQVAALVGVSRATLYNHLHDNEQPATIDAYQQLYALSEDVRSKVSIDIRSGLKSIIVNGKTLLGHLKNSIFDSSNIINVCIEIEKKLLERKLPNQMLSVDDERRISLAHSKAG